AAAARRLRGRAARRRGELPRERREAARAHGLRPRRWRAVDAVGVGRLRRAARDLDALGAQKDRAHARREDRRRERRPDPQDRSRRRARAQDREPVHELRRGRRDSGARRLTAARAAQHREHAAGRADGRCAAADRDPRPVLSPPRRAARRGRGPALAPTAEEARGVRAVAAGALLALGAASLLAGLWLPLKAALAEELLNRAWSAARQGGEHVKPWPWADTWPVARLSLPPAAHTGPLIVLA